MSRKFNVTHGKPAAVNTWKKQEGVSAAKKITDLFLPGIIQGTFFASLTYSSTMLAGSSLLNSSACTALLGLSTMAIGIYKINTSKITAGLLMLAVSSICATAALNFENSSSVFIRHSSPK